MLGHFAYPNAASDAVKDGVAQPPLLGGMDGDCRSDVFCLGKQPRRVVLDKVGPHPDAAGDAHEDRVAQPQLLGGVDADGALHPHRHRQPPLQLLQQILHKWKNTGARPAASAGPAEGKALSLTSVHRHA